MIKYASDIPTVSFEDQRKEISKEGLCISGKKFH